MSFLESSVYWGVCISLLSYAVGSFLKKKLKLLIFNPLLISVAATIGFLLLTKTDYDTYYNSAKYLSYLLTPTTVCLAVPLYEQLSKLEKNKWAILIGICSGVLTAMCSILLMSRLFGLSHEEYVTLLPKSITTAIGMGISEELGGSVTLTAAIIILTGIFGSIIAPLVCRLFRITDPIAKGIGIGTASHAIGTTRAMEMGQVEGTASSLSIVVAGVLTVLAAGLFAQLY